MTTDERELKRLAELLCDPAKAAAALPVEEREYYERCQRSVVEARRYAEREAGRLYVY